MCFVWSSQCFKNWTAPRFLAALENSEDLVALSRQAHIATSGWRWVALESTSSSVHHSPTATDFFMPQPSLSFTQVVGSAGMWVWTSIGKWWISQLSLKTHLAPPLSAPRGISTILFACFCTAFCSQWNFKWFYFNFKEIKGTQVCQN